MESKSCFTIWVDPKTIFEPNHNPQKAHVDPKKPTMTFKLGQNLK